MEPRLTLVTLGVADIARARRFYEALGFKASTASRDTVAFFEAGGVALGLFSRDALAEDAHVSTSKPGFSGITLAHNARSESEVDAVLAEAVAAGGKLLKPGQRVFWGGYSGYFSDPDGHLWEVAHNPFFAFDAAGRLRLPGSINHDNYSDAYLTEVLRAARRIAVVGASANPARPSYGVMEFLIRNGRTVVPVNPGQSGGEILGQRVFATLAEVPGPVDMVDIFRNSAAAGEAVQQAIAEKARLGLTSIWMQIGVRSDAAAAAAELAGLKVVMDRCPKIEFMRLGNRI